MEPPIIIKTDCLHYKGCIPCAFHKEDGRLCGQCDSYAPVGTRVLVIKLDALGDVLRTTSILPAIHRKHPGADVTWVTRKNALVLLKDNPLVRRVFAVEENYLEAILSERFTVGICLDADPLAAAALTLAQCEEKQGFVGDRFGRPVPADENARTWWEMGVNDTLKKANRRTYQEIIYDICQLPPPVSRPMLPPGVIDLQLVERWKKRLKETGCTKIIGINTAGGSRWQCKQWTLNGYIELARLLARGHPDMGLLLYGGSEEVEFNEAIMAEVGSLVFDTGCLNTVSEFISLVGLSDVFITPDTLGLHVAVALEKPVVVLVGPTSPWELDVCGKGRVLVADEQCVSCYRTQCDRTPTCMELLPATRVLAVVEELLGCQATGRT